MPKTSPYTKLLSSARPVMASNGHMMIYKKLRKRSKNAARSIRDLLSDGVVEDWFALLLFCVKPVVLENWNPLPSAVPFMLKTPKPSIKVHSQIIIHFTFCCRISSELGWIESYKNHFSII